MNNLPPLPATYTITHSVSCMFGNKLNIGDTITVRAGWNNDWSKPHNTMYSIRLTNGNEDVISQQCLDEMMERCV